MRLTNCTLFDMYRAAVQRDEGHDNHTDTSEPKYALMQGYDTLNPAVGDKQDKQGMPAVV